MSKIIDWDEFIGRLLDRKFSVDIGKMGSASMFVKNQLSALANQHTEKGRFRESLTRAIKSRPFVADESLNDPGIYALLMDLGIEFLGSDVIYVRECCTLFIQLNDIRQNISLRDSGDIDKLLSKSSLSIIKFIEDWKDRNEILGISDIYGENIFIKYVMQKWKERLLGQEAVRNANILLGLIYLDEWRMFSEKDKQHIFNINAGNKLLFPAIISDMERLEGNARYNYFDFAKDCHVYAKSLFEDISVRCHAWIRSIDVHPPATSHMKVDTRKYQEWVKDYIELDGSSLKNIIDTELNKDN